MTDRALFADYLTTGSQTRLLVINPETEDLFSYNGTFEITEIIVANSEFEVPVELPLATSFSLSDAYPNPFNPKTMINLSLTNSSDVLIDVYNVKGQVISTLVNGYMDANSYSLTWDASESASGVYFLKVTVGDFVKTQKLMLLK